MSLARIKRSIRIGSKLQVTRHDWPAFRSQSETPEQFDARRAAFFAVREVVSVDTVKVGFKTGEKVSYLAWPKANAIRETAKGFEVDLNGDGEFKAVMQYEYRDPLPTPTTYRGPKEEDFGSRF